MTNSEMKVLLTENNEVVVLKIEDKFEKLEIRIDKLESKKDTNGLDLSALMNMSLMMKVVGKMF